MVVRVVVVAREVLSSQEVGEWEEGEDLDTWMNLKAFTLKEMYALVT